MTNHYGLDLEHFTEQELFQGLDRIREGNSPATYGAYIHFTKRALNFLDREKLADKIEYPRRPDPATRIKEGLLTIEEVEKLIQKAPSLYERLLVELLFELGAREGEICHLHIRDVQFDEYSAILALTGKTGTRKRRVYAAVPDLRRYLNDHPQRDDGNAPFFLNHAGRPLKENRLYGTIRKLGFRILKKPIHPHQFRHLRATLDSSHFTDREMMALFGWKNSDMVTVYSHLSMRDVDDKDLILHGMKSREEVLKPIVQVQRCRKCSEENAPLAIFCVKCGASLTSEERTEDVLKDQKFIQGLVANPAFIEALKKALKS
jgi:integrase